MYKYNQKLPENVEKKLDDYIERIKKIKWFSPSPDLKKEDIDKQINLVLETFGLKASIEYLSIKKAEDRDAAWDAARGAAWDAARGAEDLLATNVKEYKKKYPKGNFINLIPLWEAGLYP